MKLVNQMSEDCLEKLECKALEDYRKEMNKKENG